MTFLHEPIQTYTPPSAVVAAARLLGAIFSKVFVLS